MTNFQKILQTAIALGTILLIGLLIYGNPFSPSLPPEPEAPSLPKTGQIDEHLFIDETLKEVTFCGNRYLTKQIILDGVDVMEGLARIVNENYVGGEEELKKRGKVDFRGLPYLSYHICVNLYSSMYTYQATEKFEKEGVIPVIEFHDKGGYESFSNPEVSDSQTLYSFGFGRMFFTIDQETNKIYLMGEPLSESGYHIDVIGTIK